MPPPRPNLPYSVYDQADAVTFEKKASDDLWKFSTDFAWDQQINGLESLLKMPEPLPVVVSDRPDAMAIRATQAEQAPVQSQPQQASQDVQSSAPAEVAPPSAVAAPAPAAPGAATPGAAPPDTSSWRGGGAPRVAMSQSTNEQPASGLIDNSSRQAFIRTAFPHMLQAAGGNRDAAEMMLAAAISENGDVGKGGDFIGNNFFGIKGKGPAGSFNAATWEDYGQGRVNINDDFAAYNTPVEGFRGFFEFLERNERYHPALERYQQTGDASQLFRDVNAAGYATDKQWADKVENIRRNQVAPVVGQPDPRVSLNAGPPPASVPGGVSPAAGSGDPLREDSAEPLMMRTAVRVHDKVTQAFHAANGRMPTPQEAEELASLGYGVA